MCVCVWCSVEAAGAVPRCLVSRRWSVFVCVSVGEETLRIGPGCPVLVVFKVQTRGDGRRGRCRRPLHLYITGLMDVGGSGTRNK